MTGSPGLQRALARLARLARPVERAVAAAPFAELGRDPLAPLAAPPFDDRLLASVLDALSGARAAEAAPGRKLVSPRRPPVARPAGGHDDASALRVPAPPSARPTAGDRQALPAGARRARAAAASQAAAEPSVGPDGAAPVPGAPAPVLPLRDGAAAVPAEARAAETGALARFAARVPGGAQAVATPLTGPQPPVGKITDGVAAAAPAADRPPAWIEPPASATASSTDDAQALVVAAPLVDLAPAEAPSQTVPPAAPPAGDVAGPSLPPAAPAPAGAQGAQGLAELVRRWEGAAEPVAGAGAAAADDPVAALGGESAEETVERVLEQLLAAELRRHGIELEAG